MNQQEIRLPHFSRLTKHDLSDTNEF